MNDGLVAKALWTSEDAAAATGGRLVGADSWIASGVAIDSRSLEPGDLFVALVAERDGHGFVEDAFARGAAAAIVSNLAAGEGAGPRLGVGDTLGALRALAEAARARAQAIRVAVTGSVGKTSVKTLIAQALAACGETHHAVKSFNNHIGVPLTLARMPPSARFAVFELGMNHRGEIAPLAALARPQVALISWIAPAHIENLGSIEAIAEEKADIFQGLEPGGIAIVPMDAPMGDLLLARAQARAKTVVRAGRDPAAEAKIVAENADPLGAEVAFDILGEAVRLRIAAPGAHWAHAALLALTAAKLAGADLHAAAAALDGFTAPEGRGAARVVNASFGAFTLIDDAYNANPASMAAAFAALAQRAPGPGGRRIVALGDMLELGALEADMHAGLAGPIGAAGIDLAFCAGPRMRALYDALPLALRGGWAQDSQALLAALVPALGPGDMVLVKGSNGARMGRVVEALAALGRAEGENDV